MSPFLTALIALVVGGAGVAILQMWTSFLAWDVFLKVMGTLGIIFVVMGLVYVLKADLGMKKKMKDENYLD
ncbi:MAG: hypothetical protein AAF182_03880 [Pseudomonadota bacterium]